MLWYRRKVGYCRKGLNCNFKNLLSVKGRAPSLSAERAGQKWSANGQKATNQ